jgi:hypothetical protein
MDWCWLPQCCCMCQHNFCQPAETHCSALAPLTSLSTLHDLVEGLLHLLADGEDEVQHLAPVACHILAQSFELALIVMDAAAE